MASIRYKLKDRGNDQFEGNKGGIYHGHIYPIMNAVTIEVADVCPFYNGYPLVLPQFPRQLTVTAIKGIDLSCPFLEEAVGKTARGGAHIEDNETFYTDAERQESPFKFQPSPAHIGVIVAPDPDFSVPGHKYARLIHQTIPNDHSPGHDERPCPLPCHGETPVNQQLV